MGVRRAKNGVGEVAERIWGECTAYRLRVINRAVSRIYDDALRPYRLRIAQLNTLVVVMQTGGLTPNDLSQRMHMDASTVSRNVERMCKSGWLELADIDDARSHEIRITPRGMKLIADVAPAWEAAQAAGRRPARGAGQQGDRPWWRQAGRRRRALRPRRGGPPTRARPRRTSAGGDLDRTRSFLTA